MVTYTTGDATIPVGAGNKIIVHICNDIGKWGKGFVMAISKRWATPEKAYRRRFGAEGFELGQVQFILVEPEIWLANLIGQHGVYKDESGKPSIRYEAVLSGLEEIGRHAKKINASVHMPRIGCGLAGGTWDKVEPLIKSALTSIGLSVTIYDF